MARYRLPPDGRKPGPVKGGRVSVWTGRVNDNSILGSFRLPQRELQSQTWRKF
jgi:hypothetical protein